MSICFPADERFLTYEPWPGDLNNSRLCLEIVLLLSVLLGRRLVIPSNFYRRQRSDPRLQRPPLHPFDLYDDAGLRRIARIVHERPCLALARTSAATISMNPNREVFCYPRAPAADSPRERLLRSFAAGRPRTITLPWLYRNVRHLHLRPILGIFYTFLFLPRELDLYCKQAIKQHFSYRCEIVQLGERLRAQLGRFFAVHVRRGDFLQQYSAMDIPAERIKETLKSKIPLGATLYVATDERDRRFFHPLGRGYRLVFPEDLGVKRYDAPSEWLAGAEQLVCAAAERFVGTRLSTFSGYITRLRGYARKPDAEICFTDGYQFSAAESTRSQFSWRQSIGSGTPLWGREYSEGWSV